MMVRVVRLSSMASGEETDENRQQEKLCRTSPQCAGPTDSRIFNRTPSGLMVGSLTLKTFNRLLHFYFAITDEDIRDEELYHPGVNLGPRRR